MSSTHGAGGPIRPDAHRVGVERFRPRPIGLEGNLNCFVCGKGGGGGALDNFAAFVKGKAGGERVVAMFTEAGSSARLSYRPEEPDCVQVKVGACKAHVSRLEALRGLCRDGEIRFERIRFAMTG